MLSIVNGNIYNLGFVYTVSLKWETVYFSISISILGFWQHFLNMYMSMAFTHFCFYLSNLQAKTKRECPICDTKTSNAVSHLQWKHKKSHQQAIVLSQTVRKEKPNPKTYLSRVNCPVANCEKPVKRLDKHLKTFHKMNPESPTFVRYIVIFCQILGNSTII